VLHTQVTNLVEQIVSLTTQLHILVFYNRVCGSKSVYIHLGPLLFLGFLLCPSFDEPQHAMDNIHSDDEDVSLDEMEHNVGDSCTGALCVSATSRHGQHKSHRVYGGA
jgi:hypothetical protein